MDTHRRQWNDRQQKLRRALAANEHSQAVELLLVQHAMLHSRKVSRTDAWSFEEELFEGLDEETFRLLPPGGEHSIAWILFHLARIEDITMNLLAAGTPQLYNRDGWAGKLGATIDHSANRMDSEDVLRLSASLNMQALRAYRSAVGRRTRQIVKKLRAEEFSQVVDPKRLQQVLVEGAVIPEAMEIVNYWGKRTIAGLLLMPPTRHNFLHLNEALQIKQKLRRR